MTDYALTGKKGTGKSKHAVLLMRDRYLSKGLRVASNLDIDLLKMFGEQSRITYVRVPDKPSAFDLLAIGSGNPDSYDEDKNGGLFLDEMATWLNTRSFADKGRAAVLDFFAHARKFGFDTWYIMQNIVQVDKQLRESFIEQTVRHTSFKKVRIPFIGWIIAALFGDSHGYLPNFHRAVFRIGVNPQDLVANTAIYVGKDIEPCYDTRQVFQESYPHGTHSVLSPWHLVGRYKAAAAAPWWRQFLAGYLRLPLVLPAVPRPVGAMARTRDAVGLRAVELARRLPVERRVSFVNRYTAACRAVALRGAAGMR